MTQKTQSEWFVYVLLCQDGSLYTGSARDVAARWARHASGQGAKYTRSHPPVKVVYQEKLASRSLALKKEVEIKRWSRAQKIERLKLKFG